MADEEWHSNVNSKRGNKGKQNNQRSSQSNQQNQQTNRNNQTQQQQGKYNQQQQNNQNRQEQPKYNQNTQQYQQRPATASAVVTNKQQGSFEMRNENVKPAWGAFNSTNMSNTVQPQSNSTISTEQQKVPTAWGTLSNNQNNNTINNKPASASGTMNPIKTSTVESQRPVSAIITNEQSSKNIEEKTDQTNKVKIAWDDLAPSTTNNQLEMQKNVSEIPAQTLKNQEQIKKNGEMRNNFSGIEWIPKKPKERCTIGDNITVFANHYALKIESPIHLFQYDVVIFAIFVDNKTNEKKEREVKARDISKQMFLELLKIYPNFNGKLVYDNKKIMFSMLELPVNKDQSLNVDIRIENSNNKQFVVKIKKAGEVNIIPNQQVDQVAIQALQILLTHNLNHRFVPVMRSYFSKNFERINLGFNLDLWKGFYVSARPSELGFNINVDVANTVFFNDDDVIRLAENYYNCKANELGKYVNDNYRGFIEELKGKRIKTYLNYTKKIVGLGPVASKHVIDVKGQKITIEKYFSQQNKQLKYPHLPCLDLGKENYTPMELCRTELTSQRKLTPKQTSDIIKATAKPAYERKELIERMIKESQLNVDPVLNNYNIKFEMKMAEINGKVLPAPDLEYGNTKLLSRDIGRKGQWDNMNKRFCETKTIDRWVVINFSSRTNDQTLNDLVYSFQTVGGKHGITFSDPLDYCYGKYNMNEKQTLDLLKSSLQKHNGTQFILAITPGTPAIYNAIKTFGDIERGIATQNLEEGTIYRQKGRYDRLVSNVCMKINVKLGGKNFKLFRQNSMFQTYLQQLYDGPLMIFGADVIHPSPLDKDLCESISAVVGSIDKDCCYYAARLQAQQQPKGKSLELIYDLRLTVVELLEEYFKANGTHPKRIVFLRDGVSEGQFKQVRNHEMNEIRQACQMRDASYKPGITFVVVQKRHHTRFFPKNKNDEAGKNANVPPGTLVDCKIITPDMFDFFLCSHMGIQGTSKPCHYFILHDDNNFTMNQMALLCHYLCHIYARSTTSVSYPAPTYYADLCAERGRGYIRNRINK